MGFVVNAVVEWVTVVTVEVTWEGPGNMKDDVIRIQQYWPQPLHLLLGITTAHTINYIQGPIHFALKLLKPKICWRLSTPHRSTPD